MANKIQIRRGLLANLPTLDTGEPAVTLDEKYLYIGGTTGNIKFYDSTYVDQLIGAANATIYKGAIDCSTNPNYPAADSGWLYRISVAGKIGGASGLSVEAGDMIICLVDSTPSGNQATVGTSWNVIQANIDGAVIGPTSATNGVPALFDGTTGKLLKNSTPTGSGNPVLDTSPTIATPVFTTSITTPVIKPAADSTTAIQVTKANGTTSVLNIDTTSGNVGIGTTGPGYPLDIVGGAARIRGTSSTSSLYFNTDGSTNNYGRIEVNNDASSGTSMRFSTYKSAVLTEQMRITDQGNVGIGTTGPSVKLETNGIVRSTRVDVSGQNIQLNGGDSAGIFLTANSTTGSEKSLYIENLSGEVTPGASNNILFRVGKTGAELNSGIINTSGSWWLGGSTANTSPVMAIQGTGNVGIGTTSPTNILSFGGNSARIWWLERHTTANTAGNTLTITAGGATSGATDKNGGNLYLQGGLSTGTGESGVVLFGCVAGATGTADRTQTAMVQVFGNKIGFFTSTPVTKATALTAVDSSTLNTGDATSDAVIANMRVRINELESKLQSYGLLS